MNRWSASILRRDYNHLVTRFEPEQGAIWYYMAPRPRPCFTVELLEDFRTFGKEVRQHNTMPGNNGQGKDPRIRFAILASRVPGVFNYGGDLGLFIQRVRDRSRESLAEYAKACIDAMYACLAGYHSDVITIALVQGDALGGGFEAALGNHVIIAEKGTQFGLPEVLFNLFPGMGAYSLLSRRLDSGRAEKMILSGRLYSADELHEMGVVDVLAEKGDGEAAVYRFVREQERRYNAFQSILKVRQRCKPIAYEEFVDVADIWVNAALKLTPKDFRLMERLVKAQERNAGGAPAAASLEETYA